VVVIVAVAAAIGISQYIGAHQPGPPAAGPAQAGEPIGVPPESTNLQDLRQDYGPWQQLAGTTTDSPALLLLNNGAASASRRWTIPAAGPGWQPDLGGDLTSATVSGDQAAIADADDVDYTVGVGQPFVIASNPGTVLLVTRGGTVLSMSLAQATAVRQSLRK
jgi:hypothetical protein